MSLKASKVTHTHTFGGVFVFILILLFPFVSFSQNGNFNELEVTGEAEFKDNVKIEGETEIEDELKVKKEAKFEDDVEIEGNLKIESLENNLQNNDRIIVVDTDGNIKTTTGFTVTPSGKIVIDSLFITGAAQIPTLSINRLRSADTSGYFALGDSTIILNQNSNHILANPNGNTGLYIGSITGATSLPVLSLGNSLLPSKAALQLYGVSNKTGLALGNNLKIGALGNKSIVIGSGSAIAPLHNNTPNSLMIGFNSSAPTLFVGAATTTTGIGKVGIGTVTPVSELDVAGTTTTQGLTAINVTATDITATTLQLTAGAGAGKVLVSDTTGNTSWINQTALNDGDWTIAGQDMYNTGVHAVGIGTNAPQKVLHLRTTHANAGASALVQGGGAVLAGGNNANGAVNQQVSIRRPTFGEGVDPFIRNVNMAGSHMGIRLEDNLTYNSSVVATAIWDIEPVTSSPSALWFGKHNEFTTMALTEDGKMGIATANPKYTLDVNGDAHINSAFSVETNTLFAKNGQVVIGTNTPQVGFSLTVCGKIKAKEVEVETGWCDYVFADDYNVKTLAEVEQYIKINKHLPNMPSENEVLENGIGVGNMLMLQQEKIEELYLYVIELQKQNNILLERIDEVKK